MYQQKELKNTIYYQKEKSAVDYSYFRLYISKRKINRKIVSLNFMHTCKMKSVFECTCVREKDKKRSTPSTPLSHGELTFSFDYSLNAYYVIPL